MKVEKKDLEKSQIELIVELSVEEVKPYIEQGAKKLSQEVKIDGFRPGNVPYDVLKQKIGEIAILEEGARVAINKTLDDVIKNNVKGQPVGQPKIEITKIAPDNPLEYKVVLALIPEVTLGDYKEMKIKAKETKVDEKEMEKVFSDIREMRAQEKITEGEIKKDYKVMVDIQMFLDKVPVEGGQGQGTMVLIGKDYIVPGFDKKLLGAKKGDIREFSLPYPEDFHMKNLAGKMVEFKATIKEVYERIIPELNDEFAVGFGVKNLEELKKNVKQSVIEQKKKETEQKIEKEMLEKILGKTKFGDIPEILIEHEVDTMMAELEQTIAQQGGKFEDYLASLKKTRDQLVLDLLPDAVKRVKISLLIREIGQKEKIKVEKEEVEKQVKDIIEQYKGQDDTIKKIDTPEYRSYVLNVLASRKVVDKLKEWNIEK